MLPLKLRMFAQAEKNDALKPYLKLQLRVACCKGTRQPIFFFSHDVGDTNAVITLNPCPAE